MGKEMLIDGQSRWLARLFFLYKNLEYTYPKRTILRPIFEKMDLFFYSGASIDIFILILERAQKNMDKNEPCLRYSFFFYFIVWRQLDARKEVL